jgi:hypothetical protein
MKQIVVAALLPALALADSGHAEPAVSSVERVAAAEIPRLASDLRRLGYSLRDSSAGTRGLVLVLSDVHLPEITGATLDGLDTLRGVFPYAVVGLENYDHDFRNRGHGSATSGPVYAALDSMLRAVSHELVEWARVAVRKQKTSTGPAIERFVSGHRAIAFGIERGDSAMLFVRAGFLYGELLADRRSALRDSASAWDPQGASHRIKVRGIEKLGSFLVAADASCPRLPDAFTWDEHAGVGLDRLLAAYSTWFTRYVGDDRNRGFAESASAELTRRHATRAVVVVGYAHTVDSGEWPSLQERLRERGEGVIVADPPAVRAWIEKNPTMIPRSR